MRASERSERDGNEKVNESSFIVHFYGIFFFLFGMCQSYLSRKIRHEWEKRKKISRTNEDKKWKEIVMGWNRIVGIKMKINLLWGRLIL